MLYTEDCVLKRANVAYIDDNKNANKIIFCTKTIYIVVESIKIIMRLRRYSMTDMNSYNKASTVKTPSKTFARDLESSNVITQHTITVTVMANTSLHGSVVVSNKNDQTKVCISLRHRPNICI